MKIHDEIDDWMAGALCDALSPDEQQTFEQHLAECPHCRSLYEETQKMNDILNTTLPELRPDPNFERRVIAGFREKIASSGFHPWRGLVWFVQFRTVQAALALLMLAAMIKGGSLATGERAPWSPPIGANASGKTGKAVDQGIAQSQQFIDLQGGVNFGDTQKKGVDLLSAPTVTTKSGERSSVAVTSNISGDAGVDFATDYYSRGILQGPQATTFQPTQYLRSSQLQFGNSTATFGSTMALTGGNTYAGATIVNAGTLTMGGNTSATFNNGINTGLAIITGSQGSQADGIVFTGSSTSLDSKDSANDGKFADASVERERARLRMENKAVSYGGVLAEAKTPNLALAPISQTQVAAQQADAQTSEAASTPAALANAPVDSSKLIRNATLDFEVQSFEKALDTITAVAGEEQGYVATQNSESGANGKLQGEIVVKVLPAHLDRFLLKLRALGDIKNQNVSTQDVTKAYFDTEARIRNSQIMETRLIDMLKNRTGRVSDLLDVEKEISRVRGQIEEMQGQIKVYDAQVLYATVTISLSEKDVNATAAYLLQEHAQLSLFAKDVDKAFADAKADAETARAQTLESHIERDVDGRTSATLHLLLPPDASDEAISKLKALGRIQNFTSQTQRVARDGSGNSDTAKVEHDKVELNLVIQRDEENAVQGTNISILTDKVEEQTAAIKQAAATAGVEVKGAEFNRAQNGAELSSLLLRMPVKKYPAFLEQIKSLGKVKDFTVSRREDATATDDAPAEIALQIYSQPGIVAPDSGLWPTIRHTLGEGFSALMWSLRMIGVSLAFIAPWAAAVGLAAWLVVRRRRVAKK